jgi:PAS domain S-box-containing protein
VDEPLESLAEEVARLRDCVKDLSSIVGLPGLRTGSEPAQIVSVLLDALLGMLQLAFVCVRLNDLDGTSTEAVRVAESSEHTFRVRDITGAIDASLGDGPRAEMFIGDEALSVGFAQLGLHGELGIIVAGSETRGFPSQSERLLLDVAANQATIALQHATHRRTEEVLRESEREWRLIVDSIPGQVALLGPQGNVVSANNQIVEYTGRTLDELKQWGTSDIVHAEDLPHVIDLFTRSIVAGTPYDILQRLRRFDGVYRWFRNSGFPLRDSTGSIARWCVLLTDIDDQKRAEDAFRASEHNLKLTIDTIPALAWSARTDGTAEFFNQHYLDFVGFSAEQASGWGWAAAVHPDDFNGLGATWQGCLATATPGEAEARLRRYDGEYRWFLFRVNPLRDETGRIVKWYGVNTDIEDRKRAEQELTRAEAELRRAYDHLTEAQRLSQTGSFTVDLESDEHDWSDEFYRICEFEPGTKVTIERLGGIVHPEDLALFQGAIGRAMAGTNPDFYFRVVTSRGVVKHLRGFAHRIAERPVFVGAVQDVTASTMAQQALNKAGAELAHVSRVTALSALTASIAHEVNQPLSGIVTNVGACLRMLDASPPDMDGAGRAARRTIRDANRAADVVARLRALFSKREFTLEPLDLNEATREVIALSSNDLQKNRVILHSDFADDLPIITGDRIQLQQVILNLLRNASDAMVDVHDRPRHLRIKTRLEDGDRVCLTVRDAGVGLSPQNLDSLFDAFYTTKSGGMGIGLFVSRSIVERHQGRLWAEPNDVGPGAMFAFSIPRGPEGTVDAATT